MKSKKVLIATAMIVVGAFLEMTCDRPASPLQLVAWAGFLCVLIGAGILIGEGIKLKKSYKKEKDETQKW